jgi:hypothetical protein
MRMSCYRHLASIWLYSIHTYISYVAAIWLMVSFCHYRNMWQMQVAHVHLTRLLEKLNYTAALENIIIWNYMQNILYLIGMYSCYDWCKEIQQTLTIYSNVQWSLVPPQAMDNGSFLFSLLRSCGSDIVIISTITIHRCFYFPRLFLLLSLKTQPQWLLGTRLCWWHSNPYQGEIPQTVSQVL